MKYKSPVFIILFSIIILLNSEANAKISQDTKLVKDVYKITGFKIGSLYDNYELTHCIIKTKPFVIGDLCLPDAEFGSQEKKWEVKNTPAMIARLHFSSDLRCSLIVARFKSDENAMLGYYDISGDRHDIYLKKSLFSGETIENAIIMAYNNNGLRKRIEVFFIYKKCVLYVIFGRKDSKVLSDNDIIFIDNFVLFIKSIIDISFPN